jgi:hypothetical protein
VNSASAMFVRAFRWQEVAMVLPSKPFDEKHPDLSVVLELLELERIDDIAQLAGNHGSSEMLGD